MAIPNRSQVEATRAPRVDSDAHYRSGASALRLFTGPEFVEDSTGIDSRGTSDAAPTVAVAIAEAPHREISRAVSSHSSAAYYATIRREEIQKLLKTLAALNRQADREDFAVCVFPIVNAIRQLLDRLADANHEGNTRELLRRLRDTFLDGGWAKYRSPSSREAAERVLDYLSGAEEVTRDDVKRFSNVMSDGGLNPIGVPLFGIEDEGEEIDVTEEEEVSD